NVCSGASSHSEETEFGPATAHKDCKQRNSNRRVHLPRMRQHIHPRSLARSPPQPSTRNHRHKQTSKKAHERSNQRIHHPPPARPPASPSLGNPFRQSPDHFQTERRSHDQPRPTAA